MITKEKGEEQAENASDKVIYKIDVPANRYLYLAILWSHIRHCSFFWFHDLETNSWNWSVTCEAGELPWL